MSKPTQTMIDDLDAAVYYLPDELQPSLKQAIIILCNMDDSLIHDDTGLEFNSTGG